MTISTKISLSKSSILAMFWLICSVWGAPPPPELVCQLPAVGNQPAETFDGCNIAELTPPVPYTWHYTLLPSNQPGSVGGATWRGGLKVNFDAGQWAGFGWGFSMVGSNAVVVRKCTNCTRGARIDGFKLTDYDEQSKIPGSFAIRNASAAVAPDGAVVAVFTADLPQTPAQLTNGGVFSYIAAVGPTAPDGALRAHTTGGFPYGVFTANLKSTATAAEAPKDLEAPPPAAEDNPMPFQAPVPAPAVEVADSPVPEEAASSPGSNGNCILQRSSGAESDGSTESSSSLQFPSCSTFLNGALKVYWTTPNHSSTANSGATSDSGTKLQSTAGSTANMTLTFGLESSLAPGQWVALGFPTSPGQMIGATAMVLSFCAADSPSCPQGSAVMRDFHLGAKSSGAVTRPGKLKIITKSATSEGASGGKRTITGTCEVSIPASASASGQLPILFATGNLDSTGERLLQHTQKGSGTLSLATDPRGSSASSAATTDSGNASVESKKNAHAWLMTIGWTFIMIGAVVARSFKTTLGPVWFQIHRAVQFCGLLCVLVAFILIFSALGSKTTTYTLHYRLGISAFCLGMAQLSALVFRPHLDSRWRRTWALGHHWVGRAAVLVSVANIYYGIIEVKKVGSWAVISYSIVFGLIIGIGALKESLDYLRLPPPALMKAEFANLDEEKEAVAAVGVEQVRKRNSRGDSDGSCTGSDRKNEEVSRSVEQAV